MKIKVTNRDGQTVEEEAILIPRSEYEALQRASAKLTALEFGGVDNWQGYENAMDNYHEWLKNPKYFPRVFEVVQ